MANVNYTVPGLIVPVRQPSSMACWAAMFTMMYSWKNQVSISIENAVAQLGPRYADCYARNSGLPIEENRNLANAAGLSAESLMNPSVDGWVQMLQYHGLLWTSYGWQVFDAAGLVETRAGRHIIIIYGMVGDGSGTGTKVKYVDPSDGAFHEMTLDSFVRQHETGFTMRPLSDTQLGQFSQIMHY
ncbi:MAG: papain-like cysteine protease family protein [Acidobacteriota bacterium]